MLTQFKNSEWQFPTPRPLPDLGGYLVIGRLFLVVIRQLYLSSYEIERYPR